ncbi:MAG: c-type cytochrome [Thioalkalispiraceae bacterium]|jgi:cytochrome c553
MKFRSVVSIALLALAVPVFAAGNADAGHSKSQVCAGCHNADGNASIPNYPKLAGQHASYLVKQLQAFKSNKRKDPIMNGQVANLSQQDMEDLAAYFSKQKTSIGAATDKKKREFGERIYRGGIENKGVAACMGCHSPDGAGNPPAKFPSLRGQNEAYVVKSLKDYRDAKIRAFDPQDDSGKIMHDVAKRMSDAEMAAVAHYISGLH